MLAAVTWMLPLSDVQAMAKLACAVPPAVTVTLTGLDPDRLQFAARPVMLTEWLPVATLGTVTVAFTPMACAAPPSTDTE